MAALLPSIRFRSPRPFATLTAPRSHGLCRRPDTFRKKFGWASNVSKDDSLIEFGSFRLNRVERSLASTDGAPIQLTRRLYDTLLFMVERPGRLLEKQALLDAVWKGAVVEENTLSRTISALRQILGERTGEHRYIETVSGLGYRFVQSVTVTQAPATEVPPRRQRTVDRGPAVRGSEPRARSGLLRGGDRRGVAEPAREHQGIAADREELIVPASRPRRGRASDRPSLGRRLSIGRRRAQGRRPGADHGAVDRRRERFAGLVGAFRSRGRARAHIRDPRRHRARRRECAERDA